jgi:hypothetical protein
MRPPQRSWALALILLSESNLTAASQSLGTRLTPVSKTNPCVTQGEIEELPGQRLSVTVPKMRAYVNAQCSNHGYQNIKPRRSSPAPSLRSGDTHTLRAEMNGAEMEVFADNSLVWEGSVGEGALSFDGPVGMRSRPAAD